MSRTAKDQAERLREMVQGSHNGDGYPSQDHGSGAPRYSSQVFAAEGQKPTGEKVRNTKMVAITSGKGGVGKSCFTLNFALSLQRQGQKVVVWDADFGFSNLHILMGTQPQKNLSYLMEGEGEIWQVLSRGTEGLEYITSGSASQAMYQLKSKQLFFFLEQFLKLRGYADYLLVDLSAGLNANSLKLLVIADEVIVVTTPQPTAMTDAYAVMKVMHLERVDMNVHLLINQVKSEKEGEVAAKKIQMVAERFLGFSPHLLGILPDDIHVVKSVHSQTPYVIAFPNSAVARKTVDLTTQYLGNYGKEKLSLSQSFWHKFVYMLNKKG